MLRQLENGIWAGESADKPLNLPSGSIFVDLQAKTLFGYDRDGVSFPIGGNGITSELGNLTGANTIDVSSADTFVGTLTGATTLSEANLPAAGENKTITLYLTGDFALTYPAAWDDYMTGDLYDGTQLNQFVIEYVNSSITAVTIINRG